MMIPVRRRYSRRLTLVKAGALAATTRGGRRLPMLTFVFFGTPDLLNCSRYASALASQRASGRGYSPRLLKGPTAAPLLPALVKSCLARHRRTALSRLLVRKELHPALQYLLLEAMREVHWAPGLFNHFGGIPGRATQRF